MTSHSKPTPTILNHNDVRHVASWELSDFTIHGKSTEEEQKSAIWVKRTYDAISNGSVKNLTPLIHSEFVRPTNPALPQTLPLLAIHKNGSKVLKLLHQAGFNLNLSNRAGQRVWSLAIERKLEPILETLIELGIDPDKDEPVKGQTRHYYPTGQSKYAHEKALNIAVDIQSLPILMRLWDLQVSPFKEKEAFQMIFNKIRPQNVGFRLQLLKELAQKGIHPTDGKLYEPIIDQLGGTYKNEMLELIRLLCEQGIPFTEAGKGMIKYNYFKEELLVLEKTAQAFSLQKKLKEVLPESEKPNAKPLRL